MASSNSFTVTDMLKNVDHLVQLLYESQNSVFYSEAVQELRKFDIFYQDCKNDEWRKEIGHKIAEKELGNEGFLINHLNHLTDNGKKYPLAEEIAFECYKELRIVCWDYTEASETLCEVLGRNGIVTVLLDDLKDFQNTYTESEGKGFIVRSAIGILHNCSVVGDNVKYFKDSGASRLIKWYADKTKTDLKDGLGISFIMTYCNVFDDDDNKIITADEAMLTTLLKLLEEALGNEDHVTTTHHPYQAIDILNSLSALASNKKISTIVIQNGILHKIYKMLLYGNDKEKTAAAEAVWQLAFTDQNKSEILEDQRLIDLLEQHSRKTEPDKKLTELQSKAGNALWVLRNLKQETKQTRMTEGHVMISYQWSSQEIALQVKDELQSEGYKIWMDVEKMSGAILDSMADAVQNASVVIMCLSQKYKDSKNCHTQGDYAYQLGKKVIPILVEDKYKADGWLGALIGTKLYFNLSSSKKFEENFKGFLKELSILTGKKNSENKNSSESRHALSKRTVEEVTKWLNENGIEKLQEEIDGETLEFLKNIKHKAPDFFFHYVTEKLGLQSLKHIMSFVKAIDNMK